MYCYLDVWPFGKAALIPLFLGVPKLGCAIFVGRQPSYAALDGFKDTILF